LPDRTARRAGAAASHRANGKHCNDNDDDDERYTGNPPADRRLLLL
jgi:hypothetical protein